MNVRIASAYIHISCQLMHSVILTGLDIDYRFWNAGCRNFDVNTVSFDEQLTNANDKYNNNALTINLAVSNILPMINKTHIIRILSSTNIYSIFIYIVDFNIPFLWLTKYKIKTVSKIIRDYKILYCNVN